jgi:hypothetical protein
MKRSLTLARSILNSYRKTSKGKIDELNVELLNLKLSKQAKEFKIIEIGKYKSQLDQYTDAIEVLQTAINCRSKSNLKVFKIREVVSVL